MVREQEVFHVSRCRPIAKRSAPCLRPSKRCLGRVLRCVGWVASLFVGAGVGSAVGSNQGTAQIELLSGWNLLSFSQTLVLAPAIGDLPVKSQVWVALPLGNSEPGDKTISLAENPPIVVEGGLRYWFFSDRPRTLLLSSEAGESTDHSVRIRDTQWDFMDVVTQAPSLRPSPSVYRWSAPTQSYQTVPAPERLPAPDDCKTPASWDDVSAASSQNYARAIMVRDQLFRFQTGPDGEEWGYQVEYGSPEEDQVPSSVGDVGKHIDAKYLAGFERVWVYTQGIALAQYVRTNGADNVVKARALARYICAKGIYHPASGTLLGWPFSWNTAGDDWRDTRLVTGANAWAIHGLGQFLTSSAYTTLPPGDDKLRLKACYKEALLGLRAHVRPLLQDNGQWRLLMTAGWTAMGLKYAERPERIHTASGEPVSRDPHERFAYYSVLDAIGYDEFSVPPKVKACRALTIEQCYEEAGSIEAWTEREISESEWAALRQRVKAENVVTEHNLDVLAVLNHAGDHHEVLGLADVYGLEAWRDQLRAGILFELWDEEGYVNEFRRALDAMVSDPTRSSLTAVQADRRLLRKQRMEDALVARDLGRVVTGGEIRQDGTGLDVLVQSAHSAIDNCTWLSLSVHDDDLRATDPVYGQPSLVVDRLARCLKYTVIQYARELGYGERECGPKAEHCASKVTYRGAHYFQNAFTDPYIAPSALQESSYHLEATMGLIMGALHPCPAPSSARCGASEGSPKFMGRGPGVCRGSWFCVLQSTHPRPLYAVVFEHCRHLVH